MKKISHRCLVRLLAWGMLTFGAMSAKAKIEHLLPRVQQLTATDDSPFLLGRSVRLEDATNNAMLRLFLEQNQCEISTSAEAGVSVQLVSNIEGVYDFELAGFPNEGYALEITSDQVLVRAITETGVTRAAQTLMQLAQGWDGTPALEAISLKDWPAFKLRGFMHDVGRSYVSVDQLKRQIDMLARFKVNVFHWHLTENQAWRFEVKQYPQLTHASSMTRYAGQYYTQEQCREVQEFAWERGVIIIPEIDMPGHSAAFRRAMGHGMQTEQGVAELKNILDEVAAVFDRSTYIHIGADEESITYPNFLETMIDKVHALGRKVVVWNPIRGVNIAALKVDMTQMWSTGGRAINGVPNIDCRYNYTNHFDVFADLVGIYKSNIYYKDKGDASVPGFISAPWNDRKTPTEADIMRQNNVYAVTIASAERAWAGGGRRYIETGGTSLPNSGEEYAEFADWERRFLFHKHHTFDAAERMLIPYVKQTQVRWRITDAMPNGGNASAVLPPETEGPRSSYTLNGQVYGTRLATGAAVYLRHTWGSIVPSLFSNPQPNNTAYAWTYVYSPDDRTAGALIEFQNYGRSENDKAPENGRWDRKGSRLWVNDKEVMGPRWDNAGVSIHSEVNLRNENFTARKPTEIALRQGWNKVFLKLPYVAADGVRLNKWMFTFVLTDVEGREAMTDLVYSPSQLLDTQAELAAVAIDEARSLIRKNVSERPGYYVPATADALNAILDAIETTLDEEMTEPERAAQIASISEAVERFLQSLGTAAVSLPSATTSTERYSYSLSTPLRGNRYATSTGTGSKVYGTGGLSEQGKWQFVRRTDDTFDIVNVADGSYLSPNSANNTSLRTSATSPSRGWTLRKSDEVGYMIITSGNVEMNQTNLTDNATKGYYVYNWGGGTNISDMGCKYKIELVDHTVLYPDNPNTGMEALPENGTSLPVFDLGGLRAGHQPHSGVYIRGGKKVLIQRDESRQRRGYRRR